MHDNIIRNFNNLSYSDEEIKKYIDIADEDLKEYKRISGNIKNKFAIRNIKDARDVVAQQLEDGEKVKKTIKIINKKSLSSLTTSSFLTGSIFSAMDYQVANLLVFTEKRMFILGLNSANKCLNSNVENIDDIVSVEFTNKIIEVKKDAKGDLKIKQCISKVKKFFISLAILSLVGAIGGSIIGEGFLVFLSIFAAICSIPYLVVSYFMNKKTDEIQLVFKDGRVIPCVIVSDDYDECRRYLENLLEK